MVEQQAGVIENIGVHGASDRSTEADLVRAAQRGDTAAFDQLVRAHDHQVLRMAYNLLHSEEDARDVYQEAFLRVYRNLPKFRFDCSFSTWLYRIVSNLCLDQLRKRKVRQEESRRFQSAEVNSRIQEVLAELTPRERIVFEMRHYQGMRLRAIGEALNVTEEAAKNCLFRATHKMRAALGDFV